MGDSLGNLSRSNITSPIRNTDGSPSSWGSIFGGLPNATQDIAQQLQKVAQQLQRATQEAMKSIDLAAAILAETMNETETMNEESVGCSLCHRDYGHFHLCEFPIKGLIGLVQCTDGVIQCEFNGKYWLVTKRVYRCPNCGRDLRGYTTCLMPFSLEEV